MENLYRIILCCNALVSLVAVNSFFFAVISPANCTHFMLIVEAVGMFACGTIITGAISFLAETLIMSFLWMRRETSMNMLLNKVSGISSTTLIMPANKAVFKNDEMSLKKEAAKNETKSQEPAANADAANTDAANADAANTDAANADAANADGANLNATNTDAAKTEKAASHGKEDPSECHSACSSQGASDTSDAISGASTV